MILADKIINERKKNGWSQEELAEQLSVSRQSVSKWESAQAIPDLQKILKMAEVFGVSTDYLLKDELEPEDLGKHPRVISEEKPGAARKVTMEEACEYLELEERVAPKIAGGVSLCIFSPAVMILLLGLSEAGLLGISENIAVMAGLLVLFILVAAAVFLFIYYGSMAGEYAFLEKEPIDTEYGVRGMVLEKKKAFQGSYVALVAVGVVLCILCPVPLVVVSILELPDVIILSMVSLLLLLVAGAVNLFVRVCSIQGSYEKLLQENDYSVKEKSRSGVMDTVAGIYWTLATTIYLAWSFWTGQWHFTWILWPVAGVFYGVVHGIMKLIVRNEK